MRRFGSQRSLSSSSVSPPRLLAVGPYAGYASPLVSSLPNNQLQGGAIFSGNTVLSPNKYKTLTIGDCRLSSDSDSLVYTAWANTINFSGGGTFDLSGYDGANAFQPCGVEGGNGGNWSGGGGAAYFPSCGLCSEMIVLGGDAGQEDTHGAVLSGLMGQQFGCGSGGGFGGSGANTVSTTQSNNWVFQNGFDGGSTNYVGGSPGIKLIGGAGAGGSVAVPLGGLGFAAGSGGGGGRAAGAVLVARFITGDGTVGVASNGGNGGMSTNCEGENGAAGGGGAIDILAKNYVAGSIAFVSGAAFRLLEIRADNTVNMSSRSTGDSWANG